MWTSPDNWKEHTAVATLTCETNSVDENCAYITSENLLMMGATQKWSGHFCKEVDFLSLKVFKWILNGHSVLGLLRNIFEHLVRWGSRLDQITSEVSSRLEMCVSVPSTI